MGMKTTVVQGLSVSGPKPIWKTTPGNPFLANDVANATHGSIIFAYIQEDDFITVVLPAITPDSVGKRVQIVNMVGEKDYYGGYLKFVPDDDDFIESFSPLDGSIESDTNTDEMMHVWLESNGVDRWSFFAPSSGKLWIYQNVP